MWNIKELSQRLKEETPKAKKDGKWLYAESLALIQLRLKSFLAKFPIEEEYTEEQVIEAYKRYLGDTTNSDGSISKYRKLLKYFIWKKEDDGDVSSILLNYLENNIDEYEDVMTKEEGDTDWTDTVI